MFFIVEDLGHEFVVDGVVGIDADGAVGGLLGFGELVLGAEEFGEFAGDAFVFLFVALEFADELLLCLTSPSLPLLSTLTGAFTLACTPGAEVADELAS